MLKRDTALRFGALLGLVVAGCSSPSLELGVKEGAAGAGAAASGGAATGGAATAGSPNAFGGAHATGGASTQGGSSGFVGPSAFSELTLGVSGGMLPPAPPDAECEPGKFIDTYTLQTGTRALSWSQCLSGAVQSRIARGHLTLSEAEQEQVYAAVRALGPGNAQSCAADAPRRLIDVHTDDGVLLLEDDLIACGQDSAERTFVSEAGTLFSLVLGFVWHAPAPQATRIVLREEGGMTAQEGDGNCYEGDYHHSYTADLETKLFTWDYCRVDFTKGAIGVIERGDRALSDAQVGQFQDACSVLPLTMQSDCVVDQPVVSADIETGGGVLRYVDDSYACEPAPEGRTFVDLEKLESLVHSLLPKP